MIYAGDELAAWARLTPPEMIRVSADREELSSTSLVWQTDPAHGDLLGLVFEWAFDQGVPIVTSVRREDSQAFRYLEGRYTPIPGAPWSSFNVRTLDELAEPVLPDGFRLATHAEIGDDAGRVEVHRSSWDSRTFTMESFETLRATWPYRADLDVVVLSAEGQQVCTVLAWFDEGASLGEFEPVGTDSRYRRLGLARAANLHAMRLLKAAGATHVAVACRGDDDYPAPWKLYESVGFKRLYNDLPIKLVAPTSPG